MNYSQLFREIVSGDRPGIGAGVARRMLQIAEIPYSWGVRLRNSRYDSGRAPAFRIPVPVISVGNLTLGGTGKTPMVKWIARNLSQRGIRVVIVSRGYGAGDGQRSDEALELAQAMPGVPHLQKPDRVCCARQAVEQLGAQAIVLDDGFQHRRLARDLDLVLLDALEPFGYQHVFPRGMLREPLSSLRRADLVCLTRADLVAAARRESIRGQVASVNPDLPWCEVAHAPTGLRNSSGDRQQLDTLAQVRVVGICGIGNPAGFRQMLGNLGYHVVAWKEFPDHYAYPAEEMIHLRRWVLDAGAEAAICTHKDLVKLSVDEMGSVPLWAVEVEMRILEGKDQLEAALVRVTKAPPVEINAPRAVG